MSGLWAGVAGFIIAILADFLSPGKWKPVARLAFWIAIGLFTYALYDAAFRAGRFHLPLFLVIAGWALLPSSSGLLIYSLFIELPFHSTYVRTGNKQALIDRGTYALTRHPALLWFGIFLVALLLVSRSRELLLAGPIWFGLDVIWVILQDRFIFTKLFDGYQLYQRDTPMLLPNYQSLRRCLATWRKEEK